MPSPADTYSVAVGQSAVNAIIQKCQDINKQNKLCRTLLGNFANEKTSELLKEQIKVSYQKNQSTNKRGREEKASVFQVKDSFMPKHIKVNRIAQSDRSSNVPKKLFVTKKVKKNNAVSKSSEPNYRSATGEFSEAGGKNQGGFQIKTGAFSFQRSPIEDQEYQPGRSHGFYSSRRVVEPIFCEYHQSARSRNVKTASESSANFRKRYHSIREDKSYREPQQIDTENAHRDRIMAEEQNQSAIKKMRQNIEKQEESRRRSLHEKLYSPSKKSNSFSRGSDRRPTTRQPDQIVTYECENDEILTNRQTEKPLSKVLENIVSLEFNPEEVAHGEIMKRMKILREKREQNCRVAARSSARNSADHIDRQKAGNVKPGGKPNNEASFHQNNQNYNNGGSRQTSSIPYVTISNGVKLSERNVESSVSKSRPQTELTKDRFYQTLNETGNKRFEPFHERRLQMRSSQMNRNFENRQQNDGNLNELGHNDFSSSFVEKFKSARETKSSFGTRKAEV